MNFRLKTLDPDYWLNTCLPSGVEGYDSRYIFRALGAPTAE